MFLNERNVILLFVFLCSSLAKAVELPGKDLLNYFNSTCPSQGDWTKLVSNDAEALISILNGMKDDPDCVSTAGAIAQLGGLVRNVANLQSDNQTKIDLEKAKTKEFELMRQLSEVTNPTLINSIETAILDIQMQKALLITQEEAKNSFMGENIHETYSQIILTTNQLYKAISNNEKCLSKNPRIISTVTSLVSSIGGGVSTINPALGLGLSAASEFLGQTIEGIRIGKLNRKVRKISESTFMNSGFQCALESLANRWCELSDARELLNFKFNLIQSEGSSGDLPSVVVLYDRKLPALLDWLSKVRAGTPAATISDASSHAVVYERWKMIEVAKSMGDGIMTEFEQRYNDPSVITVNDKFNIINQAVKKLTGMCTESVYSLGSSQVSNPLFDIYNRELAPYKLLGLSKIPTQNAFNINYCYFDPLSQWPQDHGTYIPNFNNIRLEYQKWIEAATRLVNNEFTRTLQPDPLSVLSLAYEVTGNKWKVSPKKSIDEVREFVKENKPSNFTSSAFKMVFEETEESLDVISNTLDEALISQSIDPSTAIGRIFDAAKLQFGVSVLSARLEMVVRISLDEYFKKIKGGEKNIAAQMLVVDSFLDVLRKISGKDNDELVMLDIQNAQKGALNNMRNFVDVFSSNLSDLIKSNQKRINETSDESQKIVDFENLTKLCVLLSSMPNISEKVNMKMCYGKKLNSMLRNGPQTSILSEDYLKKDFSLRSCTYRDYIRKSKIFREWGIVL